MNYIFYRNAKNLLTRVTQLIILGLSLAVILSVYSCITQPPPLKFERMDIKDFRSSPEIKVVITSALNKPSAPLTVKSDFTIVEHGRPDKVLFNSGPIQDYVVASSDNGLLFNKVLVPAQEVDLIPSEDGAVMTGNRAYRGRLWIRSMPGGKVAFCNLVDLEAYLASVVGSELSSTFPLQSLIAQAIAARTFALYEVKAAKISKKWFDLRDDTGSQAYYGIGSEAPSTLRAIEQSRGVILIYNGGLFKTFYHSTCGGYTEPSAAIFKEHDIIPLKGRKCEYCDISKFFEWNSTLTKEQITNALLADGLIPQEWVDKIEIASTLPSGRAQTMRIGFAGGRAKPVIIDASDFRSALSEGLRSTYFAMQDQGSSVKFFGRGFGHGVGMCQMGAVGMAESSISATDILRYYYPLSELARIY